MDLFIDFLKSISDVFLTLSMSPAYQNIYFFLFFLALSNLSKLIHDKCFSYLARKDICSNLEACSWSDKHIEQHLLVRVTSLEKFFGTTAVCNSLHICVSLKAFKWSDQVKKSLTSSLSELLFSIILYSAYKNPLSMNKCIGISICCTIKTCPLLII